MSKTALCLVFALALTTSVFADSRNTIADKQGGLDEHNLARQVKGVDYLTWSTGTDFFVSGVVEFGFICNRILNPPPRTFGQPPPTSPRDGPITASGCTTRTAATLARTSTYVSL